MNQRMQRAIIASILLLPAIGLHQLPDDDDDAWTLRSSLRGNRRPDIWLRPGMKKARHLQAAPSVSEDFPEAFDWDADTFSSVLEDPNYNLMDDAPAAVHAAALDHELVKLNAYCRNVRRVQPYSMNVGTYNISGCAAHVKSTRGCSSYFAYGFADGWCDCIETEAGMCNPRDYVTYNVYRLKDHHPAHASPVTAKSVQTHSQPAVHLVESRSPRTATARSQQEPTTPFSKISMELGILDSDNKTAWLDGVTRNGEGDFTVFGFSLLFNVVVISICLLCFSCCRRKHPEMYNHNAMIDQAPTMPSTSFCGWIQDSLRLSTEEVTRFAGLDQAMFLEYTILAMKILVIIGIPLNVLLAPMHIFLGGGAAGADRLSYAGIENIDTSDPNATFMYYVHCVVVWGVVIVTQVMIFNAMGQFMGRRWAWMKSLPEPRCSSVMVENIPHYLNTDKKLQDYFNRTFGRKVVAECFVVKYTKDLRFLCERMREYQRDLAHSEQQFRKTGERPQLKTWFDEKHDAISYYQDMIQDMVGKIYAERARVKSIANGTHSSEICSFSGFVTFHSVQDAATATTLNYTEDGDTFLVTAPPDPADVIYTDLMVTSGQRRLEEFIGYFWLLVMFLLFIPIVAGIAFLADLSQLEDKVDQVNAFVEARPWFHVLWNTLFGVLALTCVTSWVPTVLGFIFNGWFVVRARSFLQQRLQCWGFAWLLIYVLIVTSVGGLLITAAKLTREMPFAILEVFAVVVPLTSHFYFQYIMLQWSACALELTRWANLTKFLIYRLFNEDAVARVKSEPEDPDYHGIGSRSARATLGFVITLVFCQISPIMCILGLILFASMRIYDGYLMVYSEAVKPDLGGAFWVTQLKQTQLGVFLYIILMAGVLYERCPSFVPALIAFASIIPMMYAYLEFDVKFKWDQMPVEGIADKEASIRRKGAVRKSYEQPDLCEPLPDYSGNFPGPRKEGVMDDFACGAFTACGTHPTDNRPHSR